MSIEELKQEAMAAIRGASSLAELRDAEVRYIGRSGKLTEVLRGLKKLPEVDRREKGKEAISPRTFGLLYSPVFHCCFVIFNRFIAQR